MAECPQCAGIGEGFSTAGGNMDIVKCHWCDGTGEVTAAKAAEYREARAAVKTEGPYGKGKTGEGVMVKPPKRGRSA